MFRRALIVLDAEDDPQFTRDAVTRIAPSLDSTRFLVLRREQPEPSEPQPQPGPDSAALASLDATLIAMEAERIGADLVAFSPLLKRSARDRANAILRLATRHELPVLSVGAGGTSPHSSLERVALAMDGETAIRVMAPAVDRLRQGLPLVALALRTTVPRASTLFSELRAAYPDRAVQVVSVNATISGLAEAVDSAAVLAGAGLVVVGSDGVSDFSAFAFGIFSARELQQARCPVLLLPRTQVVSDHPTEGLMASDTLALGQSNARIALEQVGLFGTAALPPASKIAVTSAGTPHPLLDQDFGVVTVPAEWLRELPDDGAVTLHISGTPNSMARVRVLRPKGPLLLVDATIGTKFERVPDAQVVYVRLRVDESLRELREQLTPPDSHDAPLLIDASAWLDDGGADDVPSAVDAQRLLRVGLRLTIAGATITGVVARDPIHTEASLLYRFDGGSASDPHEAFEPDLHRELDLVSGSRVEAGHHISVELDNEAAREAVIRAIEAATERIHWQCYMVDDDATTAHFERALAVAAKRGVRVRILADSFYSGQDAYGRKNPVLHRLEQLDGIEVRTFRPVSGLPDLAALKQRNHRKSIIIDGTRAVVTGRNVGAYYYQGFQEVALTRESLSTALPWFDCGAILRGPLVSAVDRAFLAEWVRAGGEPVDIRENAAEGSLRARFILHDGMLDTRTFDTQLALIRHARQEIVIVNTFPLVIELQRALVAAVKRGVRVRILFGNVRPRFGAGLYFPGGLMKMVPDQLVRSRLDVVVAAGGEAYEYALQPLPKWDPLLERVFPHVHAKVLIRDRKDVVLGSANLDVTAAYWESENVLLVHDEAFAQSVVEKFEPIFASSRRVDSTDPQWRAGLSQRAWLSSHWPSLIG